MCQETKRQEQWEKIKEESEFARFSIKVITLTIGPVYTTIKPVPIRLAQILDDKLRYLSANATGYNTAFTSGRWDGYVQFYNRPLGHFPTGLLLRVRRILEEEGYKNGEGYQVISVLPPIVEGGNRVYTPEFELRPYQRDAVESAIKKRRGVISIPTGGGKTEVAQDIIHRSDSPRVLFLVPSRALLRQTVKRFRAAFPDTTVIQWGDGTRPPTDLPGTYILVATVQSAFKTTHQLVYEATAVFVDESHHCSADTFQETVRRCTKARYVIGLSATPFRSDGADMELEAWLGPIIYKVDYDHLIDNKWLVPPEFHKVYSLTEALILTQGKKTLIFSEKWEDIQAHKDVFNLFKVTMLNAKSPGIPQHLEALATGELTHIVATPMFDEGLDVKGIEAVVFFSTCGSRTKAIQRIGRAMRASQGKEKCLVIDLIDGKYNERMEAYKKEPAFLKLL